MCRCKILIGTILLVIALLAAMTACAESQAVIRVAYTASKKTPKVRVYLASPLRKNEPYTESGTKYDRDWLAFTSDNTVYKYGLKGSSVVWMLPVSVKRGNIDLYLDFGQVPGIRTAYLNDKPLSPDKPVTVKLTDTLVFKFAGKSRRSIVRMVFTTMPVVSVTAKRSIGNDSNTPMRLQITDPDYESNGWKSATLVSDGVISKRGQTAARYKAKHPYSFSVMKDGKKHDVSIAGLRNDSDWILDSAYNDASRFRNRVSMDLWDEMYRLPWKQKRSGAVGGTPVETYINGKYKGVFILNEKQDRKQVGLTKAENGGTGLLIKTQEENDDRISPAGFVSLGKKLPGATELSVWYNVEIKYPKAVYLDREMWTDFYDMTKLVVQGTDQELAEHVTDYLDLENLAHYFVLINALGINDNMRKNMPFVRAGSTGEYSVFQLLPWDMDAGYGRAYTSRKRPADHLYSNRLFKRLISGNVGGFNDILYRTWLEYKDTVLSTDHIMSLFEGYTGQLRGCGADQREISLYPRFAFYMDSNCHYTLDFEKELEYIRSYLKERRSWCDEYFAGLILTKEGM